VPSRDALEADGPTAAIRALNDAFRQSFTGGRVVMASGVAALSEPQRAVIFARVRSFADFDDSNDPHGEHDFGVVETGGTRCFWKIDCYDLSMSGHSPDPATPDVTTRVLTIMLAEEF